MDNPSNMATPAQQATSTTGSEAVAPRFSVIIPLYNKEAEIERTVRSVLAQTLQPLEIVIVDDGSTDNSRHVVEQINSPLIRLHTQQNAGSGAARNRAIALSRGEYIAMIDADDEWMPDYLQQIARLIRLYPNCGGWCSAFDIVSDDGVFPSDSPRYEGIIEDYFREAMTRYVCITSATTIARRVFDQVGGFPEGMRMGQDTYMWIKLARSFKVAYTPRRLCRYNRIAQNRTTSIYRGDNCRESFKDFYTGGADPMLDEYAARIALSRAIIISAKGGTEEARQTERFFSYTRMNRRILTKLRVINRLPKPWRWNALRAYNYLAWKIARKGL